MANVYLIDGFMYNVNTFVVCKSTYFTIFLMGGFYIFRKEVG